MTANNIFLAGASRGVGKEVANYLTAQNLPIKAFFRSEEQLPELEKMGIKVVLGDALNINDVEKAMLAEEPIDTVISTIGGVPKDTQRADYLGNKNLIDTAVKAGIKKFILISSIGTGNSANAIPPQALETLKPVLIEKEKAEQYLINSGLNYTVIRPGGLKSEPATGNAILTEDPRIAGTIHRADVARLVYSCLNSDKTNNKILAAIDENMVYGQPEFEKLALT